MIIHVVGCAAEQGNIVRFPQSVFYATLMEEMLFYTNYETNELMPWLATGYEANADFTEYTISLRDGVKWSDGEAFTADDFVFTINMLKANPTLRGASGISQSLRRLKRLTT